MKVCGQRRAQAALFPGIVRYPLYRGLRGLQGRSGRVLIISHPRGFDPRTVQPVASRYSDPLLNTVLVILRIYVKYGVLQYQKFLHLSVT
jgi:hypothetical protein